MGRMSDEEIEALLRAREVAVLATADRHGRPEATPVWYDYREGRVRVLVHSNSRKARNIRENPRVSLTVDTRSAPYRGVVLRGEAGLSGPDPGLRRELALRYLGKDVGERYLAATSRFDVEDALVSMRVTSRYSWDYSKGY